MVFRGVLFGSDTNEKRLAYTSKEKFDLLNEANPVLTRLKEEFNLTFD